MHNNMSVCSLDKKASSSTSKEGECFNIQVYQVNSTYGYIY